MQKTIKFKKWDCLIMHGKYYNGRTALELIDAEDNEPVAVATVNIPEEILEEDEVIIKDYSENEGMLDCLVENKIVTPPHRYVNTGYVTCPVSYLIPPDSNS